jgi:hypothetical protein
MANSPDGGNFKPPSLIEIVSERFRKPAASKTAGASGSAGAATPARDPGEPLSKSERKAAMATIDDVERKWSMAGLVLSTIIAVVVLVIAVVEHKTAKVGGHTKAYVSPDAILLLAAILLFNALGTYGLVKRKRTLLAFVFFIVGLALTIVNPILGFALVGLGGWLMIRAYRLQKYGTANAKQVARAAATRPSRKQRQQAAAAPVKPTGHTPPKASKRYTPKAPSKKRITKPVDKV